jgi:hypothetical protein
MSFVSDMYDLLREILSLTEDQDKSEEDALLDIQFMVVEFFEKQGVEINEQ